MLIHTHKRPYAKRHACVQNTFIYILGIQQTLLSRATDTYTSFLHTIHSYSWIFG
uniref:Uncharacterized protein n=1 Tax=Anguilla anguilla TaxID=7936 RepID=A0A0E9UM68_ANGAN